MTETYHVQQAWLNLRRECAEKQQKFLSEHSAGIVSMMESKITSEALDLEVQVSLEAFWATEEGQVYKEHEREFFQKRVMEYVELHKRQSMAAMLRKAAKAKDKEEVRKKALQEVWSFYDTCDTSTLISFAKMALENDKDPLRKYKNRYKEGTIFDYLARKQPERVEVFLQMIKDKEQSKVIKGGQQRGRSRERRTNSRTSYKSRSTSKSSRTRSSKSASSRGSHKKRTDVRVSGKSPRHSRTFPKSPKPVPKSNSRSASNGNGRHRQRGARGKGKGKGKGRRNSRSGSRSKGRSKGK